MKIAPIMAELEARSHDVFLLHTGQHYGTEMSDAIFLDLGIRDPDVNLGVGSGSHAQQTARLMEGFEPILKKVRPDWVLVVGDVNSTLACSLVAAKLREELGCRIVHVEAGLRSRDWRMPEEVNRVLTDRLSDLLLTPSRDAHANLDAEGIPRDRVVFVGNVMIDTLFHQLARAREIDVATRLGFERGRFAVATMHRPSNVDSRDVLEAAFGGLARVAEDIPVVFPMHPRTRERMDKFAAREILGHTTILEPVSYLEMLSLIDAASVVLTDSGGIQEETTALGVPCVTLREQTERPATIAQGTNRLVHWPLSIDGVYAAFAAAAAEGRAGLGERCPEGWDGKASLRIVDCLESATR